MATGEKTIAWKDQIYFMTTPNIICLANPIALQFYITIGVNCLFSQLGLTGITIVW